MTLIASPKLRFESRQSAEQDLWSTRPTCGGRQFRNQHSLKPLPYWKMFWTSHKRTQFGMGRLPAKRFANSLKCRTHTNIQQ